MNKLALIGWATIGCMLVSPTHAVEKWTSGGDVTFTVEVEQPACNVHVGLPPSENKSLDLGTISNKEGAIGHRMPLVFQFKDCTNVSVIESIAYTADIGNYPGSELGSPTKGFISTDKTKVRLFLFKDSAGDARFEKKEFAQGLQFSETDRITACYIEPRIISGQGDALAGSFEGRASFTITYQ